jgi:hypothetical protein
MDPGLLQLGSESPAIGAAWAPENGHRRWGRGHTWYNPGSLQILPGRGLRFQSARRAVHDGDEVLGLSSKSDVTPNGTIPLTSASSPAAWPWPDDLDAMIAAPEFHTVLFEDDRVRVLDGRVPAGATVPVHTHRWGGVLYILATSDFVRRDPDGAVLADTRASKSTPILGSAVWGAPLTPHSLENVGREEFRTITVEMKDGNELTA